MMSTRILIHRIISWWLFFFAIITIIMGYAISRHWVRDITFLESLHLIFEWCFIFLGLFHIIYSFFFVKIKTLRLAKGIKARRGTQVHWLRITQQVTKWIILIFAAIMIFSGLTRYTILAILFSWITPFIYHADLDGFLTISLIIHVMAGAKLFLIRKKIHRRYFDILILISGGFMISGTIYLELPSSNPENQIIIGERTYQYDPEWIESIQPQIFETGSFSVFDILVHLDAQNLIEMEFSFNSSLNTHVIESINGENNWWYHAYYMGGFIEQNAFRMDLFPWKEGIFIELYHDSAVFFQNLYSAFREETTRLVANGNEVVIPEVIIEGDTFSTNFYNVTVTAHNLRDDIFADGVITAIDVILSLGDQLLLNYTLQWYDSMGQVEIVRSFWVKGINSDINFERCGFGYESGSFDFYHKIGNYINIPSDTRTIISPEYIRFFWHCL